MPTQDGFILAQSDRDRLKRMLDWFENRVEPFRPAGRRTDSDDGALVYYELSEEAVEQDQIEVGPAWKLDDSGNKVGDPDLEISHLLGHSNAFKGARGIAARCAGRLVAITPGYGWAVAVQKGEKGGFFQARVEADIWGFLPSPQPQIAIHDRLDFETNSNQRVWFQRAGGYYYHVNSSCPTPQPIV